MSGVPPGFNTTLLDEPWLCTYATCPVSIFGQIHYIPSLAGNALYLAIFALCLLVQIGLGFRYRTCGFLVAMIGGIGLEIVGYTARVELHIDDFNNNYFIIYLVGTYPHRDNLSRAATCSLERIRYLTVQVVVWYPANELNRTHHRSRIILSRHISLLGQSHRGIWNQPVLALAPVHHLFLRSL